MDKQLEFIPQDGTYGLPYAANAAGILYNKDMFEQHGWETPETWNEFTALCEQIQSEGVQPLYFVSLRTSRSEISAKRPASRKLE